MTIASPPFRERDHVRVINTKIRGIITKMMIDPSTGKPAGATLALLPGISYNGALRFRLEQLEHDPPAPGTKGVHKPTGLPIEVVRKENVDGREKLIVSFAVSADELALGD